MRRTQAPITVTCVATTARITGIPKRPIPWTFEVTRRDGSRVTVTVWERIATEVDALNAVEGGISAELIAGGLGGCCPEEKCDLGPEGHPAGEHCEN